MGIHYDYKSTKSAKLMEKQAKREKDLDASKPITLDFLTNPNKE